MGILCPDGRCRCGHGPARLSLAPLARPCHIGAVPINGACPVTNRIAFTLIVLICAILVVDVMIYGSDHLMFLFRKMLELLEWLAFWR